MNKVSIEKDGRQDLLGLVFSWSLRDVLNKDLYSNKVNHIRDRFSSTAHYLKSFEVPLIEETRAEFCSGLESVGQAPACEISAIWFSKDYKPPKNLYYNVSTNLISDVDNHPGTHYEPQSGDIFAVTNLRPKKTEDLIRPDKSLHFAFVSKSNEGEVAIEILSSEKIDRTLLTKKHGKLYSTYLMNITTNMRIWKALHPDPDSKNLGLIQKVQQYRSLVDDECSVCLSEEVYNVVEGRNMLDFVCSFGLDESQKEAVLSSVSLRKCSHKDYNVKLIWGPPGTGKTKTVASMLLILLKLNCCSTLTCAPTNVAVIQVAKRLVTLFMEFDNYEGYGLGDIVLFGNEERMKIDNHSELVDIFLKYRVEEIQKCLDRFTGWKSSMESMMPLLEDPQALYNSYLVKKKGAVEAVDNDKEAQRKKSVLSTNAVEVETSRSNNTKVLKKAINQSLRENEKENKKKGKRNGQGKHLEEGAKECDDKDTKTEKIMTFEEFERKSFCSSAKRLVYLAGTLCTHLPTSCLPLNVAKQMIRLVDLLRKSLEKARNFSEFSEFMMMKRAEILSVLKGLHCRFPNLKIDGSIRDFCLAKARLIFCTASGAIKMRSGVRMVIIDEAAQLKECESAIPLQIPGVKTAILIGDDRQLPAMVQSKVLEKTNFGRSLFQRLARLGKNKHLLNIQYRMHPSISSFPNKEFYENKIVNAPNVQERSYVKRYLKGDMYGSYSFINVSRGEENFKKSHSPRNLEEAAVVERIIAKLFKDYYCVTKGKVSVGVISPYKGQVGLLQEKLEKKYANHENFCINIRSVDGFQGGEEDVIIISTVRCNGNGAVGFLSNFQRTNVALTRARYCLWIVGSGSTLGNSGSVWSKIVLDAKTRGCFYNADDDIGLNKATSAGKPDFFGCLRLEKARWKVIFSNEFKISILSIESLKVQKRVKEMLHNIADGRHQNNSKKSTYVPNDESVALELLETYKVDGKLNLVWTVDILKEESSYTQVIKVWDVLPASKIPNLAKNLSVLFGRYTVDFMNSCKHKSFDGNLVVPMSWPLHSFDNASLTADPTEGHLSHQLAGMNIRGNRSESSSSVRNNNVMEWKQVQR